MKIWRDTHWMNKYNEAATGSYVEVLLNVKSKTHSFKSNISQFNFLIFENAAMFIL